MPSRFPRCEIIAFLLICSNGLQAQEPRITPEVWYPFIKDHKWGFIDEQGAWKIQPKFDAIYNVFDHDIVRVWVDKKWGYIDRSGNWVVKPQFEQPLSDFSENGYQVVIRNKKAGILKRDGHVVVPPKYDDLVPSQDRAWVRVGKSIGVIGFDGKWIHQPDIPYNPEAALPGPLNSDGVAWFQESDEVEARWGLVSADGTVLFKPQFMAHGVGRHEEDAWDHPEGTDFQSGRAWVNHGNEFWLISKTGEVIIHKDFTTISQWSEGMYHFSDKKGAGLISSDGKIVFYGEGVDIRNPHEGVAVFGQSVQSAPNVYSTTFGLLSSAGQVLVPTGTYTTVEDFHEGFAAAMRNTPPRENPQGDRSHDSHAGFLGRNGEEAIPFTFYKTRSFSDGLAPVLNFFDADGSLDPNHAFWGYVNHAGKEQIPREFAVVTPFFHDRAWACKSSEGMGGSGPKIPVYAMIDPTGKALTDFRFVPPDMEKEYFYKPDELLAKSRWRGNLAIIIGRKNGLGGLGLADADGHILIEPQFNELGPMSDGMILAVTWDGQVRRTGFINGKGELTIPAIYAGASDFEDGSAWVTKRTDDHKGHVVDPGWMLIDHEGKLLTEISYLDPAFIVGVGNRDADAPKFMGHLACIAAAKTFQLTGQDRLFHLDWGYIDHTGHIVAWHKAD